MITIAFVSTNTAASGVAGDAKTDTEAVSGTTIREAGSQSDRAAEAEADSNIQTANDQSDAVQEIIDAANLKDDVALSISYDPDVLTIRTKTEIPARLKTAVAVAAPRLSVVWATSDFDVSALNTEAARVAGLPGVTYAGPNDDYSGLKVGVQPAPRSGATKLSQAQVSALTSYPVTIETTSSMMEASRDSDVPPPWGGALLINEATGATCTAGIPVLYDGSKHGITTADHCGNAEFMSYAGTHLGTTVPAHMNIGHDIQIVHTAGATEYAWQGAWNSTSYLAVKKVLDPVNGQLICTNGAVSSSHCNGTSVSGINMYTTVQPGNTTVGPGFWVWNQTVTNNVQDCAGMSGDSGSPLFNHTDDGKMKVRGFMEATSNQYSTSLCSGHNPHYPIQPTDTGTNASSRIFALNGEEALSSVGATAITN
ncbi:MAG TPA: hypothetical protein VHA37_03495 [Candidatus Saccharimonadales bacterium]|nr:hypothetical protein [Candidatus Saccharimonadales bacterium]